MALIKLALGAEMDLATGDELADSTRSILEAQQAANQLYTPLPRINSGTGVVLLGSPPNGRTWNIVSLLLLGTDDHTSVAGATVALYVGNPANAPLSDCINPGQSVPMAVTFARHCHWVFPGETLYCNVTGTASLITVRAGVHEYRYRDVFLKTGN